MYKIKVYQRSLALYKTRNMKYQLEMKSNLQLDEESTVFSARGSQSFTQ